MVNGKLLMVNAVWVGLSVVALSVLGIGIAYLYALAVGSVLPRRKCVSQPRSAHRFAIAIPAHDEEAVIGQTVDRLLRLDYPRELFDIFVVADYCADDTAQVARQSGAVCYERRQGRQGSKGAALAFLFERILQARPGYDAILVFDADTRVDGAFLSVMDSALAKGQVVQGCHRISNPDAGWFAALTWAMFIVDNRFQNMGRSNLGWSAKQMGDSICFRSDVVRAVGWTSESLTEDYEYRLQLLVKGIKIAYEPAAVGYGEAPVSLAIAQKQRARWLRGTSDASRRHVWLLLCEGLRKRDLALLDGAAQIMLPSYSTLTLLCVVGVIVQWLGPARHVAALSIAWGIGLVALFVYPLLGLALERAPVKAYLAIVAGSFFMVWRTWLAVRVRLARQAMPWVRTPHGEAKSSQ